MIALAYLALMTGVCATVAVLWFSAFSAYGFVSSIPVLVIGVPGAMAFDRLMRSPT